MFHILLQLQIDDHLMMEQLDEFWHHKNMLKKIIYIL